MKGTFKIIMAVFLACLTFLVIDVRHRVTGFQAVHGQGIPGTVTVTECEAHRMSKSCTGDFVSADSSITLPQIRANGAATVLNWSDGERLPASATDRRVPAVVTTADSEEAWTVEGAPWLRPSGVLLATLAPVVAVLMVLRSVLNGGLYRLAPFSWYYRMSRMGMMRGGMRARRP